MTFNSSPSTSNEKINFIRSIVFFNILLSVLVITVILLVNLLRIYVDRVVIVSLGTKRIVLSFFYLFDINIQFSKKFFLLLF
jgi:hypothetical protein